jgi:hypothetical protein
MRERVERLGPEQQEDSAELKKIALYVKGFMRELDCDMSEGWSRVETAAALCGIFLRQRSRRDTFTLDEAETLHVEIKRIQHYGSGAAYLWELLKSNGLKYRSDLEALERSNFITSEQRIIFENKLPYCDLWKHENFNEVELEYKKIFFEAATKFGDDILRKLNTKWTRGPGGSEKDIILEIESKSGDKLDLTRLQLRGPFRSKSSDSADSKTPEDSPVVDERFAGNSPSPQIFWQPAGTKGSQPRKSSGLSTVTVRSGSLDSPQPQFMSHENSTSEEVFEKRDRWPSQNSDTQPPQPDRTSPKPSTHQDLREEKRQQTSKSAPPEQSFKQPEKESARRPAVSKTVGLPSHHLPLRKKDPHAPKTSIRIERKIRSP